MRYIVLVFTLLGCHVFAQHATPIKYNSDQFVNTVEQSIAMYAAEYARTTGQDYNKIIASFGYKADEEIVFSDDVYCERLKALDKTSPFSFECNEANLNTIRFFAKNRRGFARIVLGRSKLYFDMYEAKLSEYGLPLELKYLSVIESGLRPQVKSRAGALGLWQFMYGTGKMFGLKENSYIDERMDPEKATDAACRYLKQLHNIYNDWNLALAAYNAGPGNVNKAIRRSGNKTTYWEVRPFLPKETQGYVPNFVAAAYLLTYHAEHNIVPAPAAIHFAEMDTICLNQAVHMSTITKLVNWHSDDIKAVNPVYKTDFIPQTEPKQCLYGPIQTIGKLVTLEDSLYALEQSIYNPTRIIVEEPKEIVEINQEGDTVIVKVDTTPTVTTAGSTFYHKVNSGETLNSIAAKYGTTIQNIMQLNGLTKTSIYVGQRLKIEGKGTENVVASTPTQNTPSATATNQTKYYVVKTGDTFGKIAQKHGKTITQLKSINPGVNIERLQLGQKLRVR